MRILARNREALCLFGIIYFGSCANISVDPGSSYNPTSPSSAASTNRLEQHPPLWGFGKDFTCALLSVPASLSPNPCCRCAGPFTNLDFPFALPDIPFLAIHVLILPGVFFFRYYFWNEISGETQWHDPGGMLYSGLLLWKTSFPDFKQPVSCVSQSFPCHSHRYTFWRLRW